MQRIVYLLALAVPIANACTADDTTAASNCFTGLTVPTSTSKDDFCKYLTDYAACYPTSCCTDTVKQAMDTQKTTYKSMGFDCSMTCGEGSSSSASGALRSAVPFMVPAVALAALVAGFSA